MNAGFEVHDCSPRLGGISFREDLKTRFPELVGDPEIARRLIEGERRALLELRPDLLVYGFWPMGAIAGRHPLLPKGFFGRRRSRDVCDVFLSSTLRVPLSSTYRKGIPRAIFE